MVFHDFLFGFFHGHDHDYLHATSFISAEDQEQDHIQALKALDELNAGAPIAARSIEQHNVNPWHDEVKSLHVPSADEEKLGTHDSTKDALKYFPTDREREFDRVRNYFVQGVRASASSSFGDSDDNIAPPMRQALHHIYGPQAALTDGYGYWVSEKWPNNDGAVTYTVDMKDRFPVSGLVVDWAYAPKQVRLLCSGDGEHHWHVVNNWHVNPTGYGWEGFSQHFRFPVEQARACQLQMMGKQPWGYKGINHLAFIGGNPVEVVSHKQDAPVAAPDPEPQINVPPNLTKPLPAGLPTWTQKAEVGGGLQTAKPTATRDPVTGQIVLDKEHQPPAIDTYGTDAKSPPQKFDITGQM